ncbi:HAD family hydrolase [Halalkalicoccus subterraneus]|uniref:HAD family hydrolase n=1 Tax=Halalkalicoccus subterraneus TaxID=2675002 RepID=UPI000EFBE426|nr:HAD-IA family hydrolase [Halalkalicoccus subterraneus]
MADEPRRIDDGWEAIVYDLDGTLVDLAVDWDEVATAVVKTFAERDVDTSGTLWDLLERASEVDLRERVEEIIAEYERGGAHRSVRLALAEQVVAEDRPVAVCSLNCEEACRIALEEHGLTEHVDAVIGRDSVAKPKPDPEPLVAAARALGVPLGRTVFVGDTDRDAITAERAGTGFLYVRDLD